MTNELIYWIALSQVKHWGIEKINKLIIRILIDNKILLSEFFNLKDSVLINEYNFDDKDLFALSKIKADLPKYSFLTEDLLAQGYEIITISSPKYSKTLKENLKIKFSPPVLYVKGNTQLLQENSIAIVGSRDAGNISLQFTDNIAQLASKQFKVVVSGFAKGVDKQALDSAIKYQGQSIIVLPQGIMTFNSGFNKYYKEIQRGDVLVLSSFYPQAPWSVQLAMARNPVIYGLADEIYVAQTSDKGGTWSGVIDGIRKGREIFVRKPDESERNANALLIEKGAIPIDFYGNKLLQNETDVNNLRYVDNSVENKIIELLAVAELSSAEIIKSLKLDWKTNKLTSMLKNISEIKVIDSKPLRFTLKTGQKQNTLFSS